MKLFIDTSNSEKIVIKFDNLKFTAKAKKKRAQYLLEFIDKKLKEQKKDIKEIKEIKVNTGPGSFTGLRVGVSVANALGWSLGISVNGKNLRKKESVAITYE